MSAMDDANFPARFRLWPDGYVPEDGPHDHDVIRIWRPSYAEPKTVRVADLPPEFNIFGLYWRPNN